MAALGFGVGDIILLTNKIIKTVKDIRDAPEELQDLAERVGIVEMILQSTHEKLPPNAPTRNMTNIVRLKDRVKEVLKTMNRIVNKYRDNAGRVNLLHRVIYSVRDKGEIAKLVIRLEERTKNLTDFLLVLILDINHQIRPLVEQILAQTRQDPEPANIQNSGSDPIDQVQAVLDRILQSERLSDPTLLAEQEDVSIEKEISVQLEQAGVRPNYTEALMEMINKQRNQLYKGDIDPISYTGGRNRLENPKGWIMVVDSYNEVRSIMAQFHLEFIRVQTVNNSGKWLFNRVESAGVQVETKFAKQCFESQPKFLIKGGQAPQSAALRAISGKESPNRSDEKKDILARIAQHRSRGLDNWHFRKYEYMLCFSKLVYENVQTLKKYCKKRYGDMPSYAKMSEIILIKDIQLESVAISDADATTAMAENIKNGIKSFLEEQYHWTKPTLSIRDGPFRTKQIVLHSTDVNLSPAEEEAKVNEIAVKTDCRIRVTDERFDSQLISITGCAEALPLASSLLRKALLSEMPRF